MAMTLVSTVTVGSGGAASIEFTNIPQTGKDLLFVVSARDSGTDGTTWQQYGSFLINGSGGLNRIRLRGNGSTVATIGGSGFDAALPTSTATSNTFGSLNLYISNYTQAINHSMSMENVTEHNGTSAIAEIYAFSKAFSSLAVSSIAIYPWSGFAQHSTASLYIIS